MGAVQYKVLPNAEGAARTGALRVGDLEHPVTQKAGDKKTEQ